MKTSTVASIATAGSLGAIAWIATAGSIGTVASIATAGSIGTVWLQSPPPAAQTTVGRSGQLHGDVATVGLHRAVPDASPASGASE